MAMCDIVGEVSAQLSKIIISQGTLKFNDQSGISMVTDVVP